VVVGFIASVVTLDWLEGELVQSVFDPDNAAAAGEIIREVLSGLRRTALLIAFATIVAAVVVWYVTKPEAAAESEAEAVSG
jgi:hypothetical protein